MDKLFGVGSSNDSVDSAVNHAKYTDELTELSAASAEMATQLQKMTTNFPTHDTLEKARATAYSTPDTASVVNKSSLKSLYLNLGLTDAFNSLMHYYDSSSLKKKEFYLDHSPQGAKKVPAGQTKLLKELDTLENFFFDFVQLTEEGEGKTVQKDQDQLDQNFMQQLNGYSTSLKLIYQDEARKAMYKEKRLAQR